MTNRIRLADLRAEAWQRSEGRDTPLIALIELAQATYERELMIRRGGTAPLSEYNHVRQRYHDALLRFDFSE